MSEGFNKTVHYRDPKSGKVVSSDPYRVHVMRQGTDAIRIFERNGVKYYENGEVVEQAAQVAEATLDAVVSRIETAPATAKITPAAQATVVIPKATAVRG